MLTVRKILEMYYDYEVGKTEHPTLILEEDYDKSFILESIKSVRDKGYLKRDRRTGKLFITKEGHRLLKQLMQSESRKDSFNQYLEELNKDTNTNTILGL